MTLDLPADSPLLELPWILTIAPASEDEEWDPIVFGPYEREHALALGAEVVTDQPLVAVVEPIFPHVSVDAIREEIAVARAAALEHLGEEEDDDADSDIEDLDDSDLDDDEDDDEDLEDDDDEDEDLEDEDDDLEDDGFGEHTEAPSAEDVRAGISRVAARLLADHLADDPAEA